MGSCCSKSHQVSPETVIVTDKKGDKGNKEDKEDKEDKEEQDEKKEINGKEFDSIGSEEDDDDEKCNPIHPPHVFDEIIDAKHIKYLHRYQNNEDETLFWGIGIENETYLQWSVCHGSHEFKTLRPKRERYSVDYYKNFVTEPLEKTLESLKQCADLTYPVFINSHTFQKTDCRLQHKTLYDAQSTPNPAFTESIHDYLMRVCPYYKESYDQGVVFDGDTIEFITQNYYCSTVQQSVNELVTCKQQWIDAVQPCLDQLRNENKWLLPCSMIEEKSGQFEFPKRNEGLVTFLTTSQKNLSICNTQTLHLNLTFPTRIQNGVIMDKKSFMENHLAFVSLLQVIEPLIVASYGTPDIFSIINTGYSLGSQRVTRSRYISLQGYDVNLPMNGKLLLQARPEDPSHWYNRIMGDYYQGHTEIGYDVNVNKFKNHGVEIRFLDWFPEEYIKGLMDFFVLLGQHAIQVGHSLYSKSQYNDIIIKCLRKGFTAMLTVEEICQIWRDLKLEKPINEKDEKEQSPYMVLCDIKKVLYSMYSDSKIVECMSPDMKEPHLVNYNEIAFQELYNRVFGKRALIIRAESSIFEQRVPIVPRDVPFLLDQYTVYVESSSTRCFSDDVYREAGAVILPSGSWIFHPHSLVIGLKTIPRTLIPKSDQTHFYFAHCFKEQEGYRDVLEQLRHTSLIDYEFMLDDFGKRTLSFCKQAGYVGGYLTLMAYYGLSLSLSRSLSFGAFEFSEKKMNRFLEGTIPYGSKPRILLIGYGTVGKSCKDVFDRFHLECDVKRSGDCITADEILSYDILAHAIRLDKSIGMPFLTEKDLDRSDRRLSLICDLSCDLGHPLNPLPIYEKYGTREQPIQRLRSSTFFTPALDLIAVPYLPSFDPVHSSVEFSNELIWYLSEWKWVKYHPERNVMTRAMKRSMEAFQIALQYDV